MTAVAPNLFIIGAPKCGTTSLFHWLEEHPDICGALEKETYYLLDQDYPMRRAGWDNYHQQGLAGYSTFFRNYDGEPYRMEATPDYLYQKTALDFISKLDEVKVVLVLRKPSDRVYSLYQFARNNAGTLDIEVSFQEFVDAIQSQKPLLENKPILSMAIQHSCYVNYLEQWLAVTDKQSIHIMLFEDLVSDPKCAMQYLSYFLSVDSSFYDGFDFVAYNQTSAVKSKALHQLRCKVHAFLGKHGAKYIPARVKQVIHSIYSYMNQNEGRIERKPQEKIVIEELDDYFEPFNRRLEALTDINLEPWRQ